MHTCIRIIFCRWIYERSGGGGGGGRVATITIIFLFFFYDRPQFIHISILRVLRLY